MKNKKQNIIAIVCTLIIIIIMIFLRNVNVNRDAANIHSDGEILFTNSVINSDGSSETSTNISEAEESTTQVSVFEDINIAFTGDILLADNLYTAYQSSGITGFISPAVASLLKDADITFVNEEFPFSNRGTPEANKEYTYCVPPERAQIFKDMGVDIVSISNNHILDYGQDALVDTFPTLDKYGIDYVGAGKDLDRAKQLVTYEVNGKTIGFLAASRVVPSESWYALNETENHAARPGVFTTYDDTALCEEIRKANEVCDFLIVYAHWGIERQEVAADYQRTLAYDYIDSGADLVIGSHPHVMQGMEFYKDVPIVYSMGNFLFSNYYSRTTVVTCTIKEDNSCSISFLPCGSQSYYTYESDENGVTEFYDFLNRVSFGVTFDSKGNMNYTNH